MLLLGAANLSELPDRSADSAAPPATLSENGPVVVSSDESEPTEPMSASVDSRDAELRDRAVHLKFTAIYGDPTRMTLPIIDFSEVVDSETLWLARTIYSETKMEHEQELVAWVIRNRVEQEYRGKSTYEDVVLDPYQFSAFNPGRHTRVYYKNLTPDDSVAGWQTALRIAHYVRHADGIQRPLPKETLYFFSERSMPGHQPPHWANYHQPVAPNWSYQVDQNRFRFYKGTSS